MYGVGRLKDGVSLVQAQQDLQGIATQLAKVYPGSNLGQGAPEVGPIPEAPDRILKVEYDVDALEYAPTTGVKSACNSALPATTMQT